MKKAKNTQRKKYILWICMAMVVALLAALPLMATPEEEAEGPQASILTGTVQPGNIQTVIRGGGNLEAKDQESIQLPDGVKITEFLVTNGDLVTEGTPLAAVDRVTLMEAIVQVQETLEYLQKQMLNTKDDTVSSYIRASAGGRIKKLYGQPGESVRDVMLRDGALALLSLDGRMAVTLERDMDLATGDTVCVIFDDDTEVEGRVESSLKGTIVVTIEDEGYPIGESVTVTTNEGTRVGRGELYAHNTWLATGFTGTITTVHMKEGDSAYAGAKLYSLTDTEYTAELERLAKEHREYESLLQDMLIMYESGAILSPCDGIVSGIDTESAHLLSAEEISWETRLLNNAQPEGEKGWTIVLLRNDSETPSWNPGFCTRDENCTSWIHFPGCPKGDDKDEEDTPPADTGYTGYLSYVLSVDTEAGTIQVVQSSEEITVTDPDNVQIDASSLSTVVTLSAAAYPDGTAVAPGDYLLQLEDDSLLKLTVSAGEGEEGGTEGGEEGGTGEMPDLEGMTGKGDRGNAQGGSTPTPVFEPYPLEGETLMTVTAQAEAAVNIAVDEHDIARLQPGMTAEVTVNALRGQVFEGTVTALSYTGTNNGGSSKFSVEITLPMADSMISGMSATVSIPLYTQMEVLTIPVAALAEQGTETVVYTALDPETGEPASPVAVTTGVSDGETVEILAGLESGQRYYYSYYDTLEVSTAVERPQGFGR